MHELRGKLQRSEISISDAIVECLPGLRGHVPDETLVWLASELQGYSNAAHFYQDTAHNLPLYRVVKGKLKLVDVSGSLSELELPFANRGQFFLGAPIAWLEEFAKLPGPVSLVELPDLTAFLGGGTGNVACECTRDQLTQLLSVVRHNLLEVMDKAVTKSL